VLGAFYAARFPGSLYYVVRITDCGAHFEILGLIMLVSLFRQDRHGAIIYYDVH
jgi:hypothetical protein